MKIALDCNSILLKKSLDILLATYVVSKKQCDFLISDYEVKTDKPVFFIGTKHAHIQKPFSKDDLIKKVVAFYEETKRSNKASLEEQVEALTKEFSTKLVKLIKEHYEH